MGGKTKQSQRTKNNVRPSSSSRSAELLNNSVSLDSGLVTISSGKVLPALFPSLATVNLEHGLNPEFQMCIKKLNKKDPITRAKALQELSELVNKSNVDDVVACLPSWAHFYKTLTADTDRKVREMTQLCHGSMVRACGRRAAPQLRALLPPWLQAQYDEHAPAQAHANNSLKSTFPDAKLPEVISFCKTEVMAHFLDNLIGNAEALINKNDDEEEKRIPTNTKAVENAEERLAAWSRVVTSSLRGLEFLVPRAPAPLTEWLWAALAPLLDHGAFWKFAAHEHYQVRAAWFGAMGCIMERFQCQFAATYGVKAVRLMLNAARDTNTLVAAQVWTCLLQFMHNVENWQQYLEKKELLVKRIFDVLETGGWGDARHLSTMLLPLLAHLPDDVLTRQFYESFFNAVFIGLDKKNILSSKSERQSWITSLAECLRYLSIQQNDFVVEITTSVHRTWLEKILSANLDSQVRNNLIKCSAANMTSIVKYWLKQSKEENSEKYDQLLRNFWQNIGSTVLLQIDKCSTELDDIERLMDGHITLLQSLKTSFTQETKKQQSIKFDKAEGDEPSGADTRAAVAPPCDEAVVHRYKHSLDDLVYKIIAQYFEIAAKRQISGPIFSRLITLIVQFESAALFVRVARQLGADGARALHHDVLRGWLAGDTMRCKALLEIVFIMIKYLTEEEQDAVFESFNQLSPCVVEWCLSLSASHPHARLAAARRWARGAAGARALSAVARRAAAHQDARAAALLLVCLADGPDAEPLVSAAGVSRVVWEVSAALAADGAAPDAESGRLAARLVTALAPTTHSQTEEFALLVTRLFNLNFSVPLGDSRVSPDTWRELRSSWQDGLAALPQDARQSLLNDAADMMHEQLLQQKSSLNIKKLEQILSLSPELFVRGAGGRPPADLRELELFSARLLALGAAPPRAVGVCALRHDCVTARLNCLYDDDDDDHIVKQVIADNITHDHDDLTHTDLLTFLNELLMRAIHLRNLLLQKVTDEDDDDSDEDDDDVQEIIGAVKKVKIEETWCDTLLSDEYFETEFCKILYDYVVMLSLYDGYKFWSHYHWLEQTKSKMDAVVSGVIGATSSAVRRRVVSALSRRAAARGYYWAVAQRRYVTLALPAHVVTGDDDLLTLNVQDITSGNGFFHMLQACPVFSCSAALQYKAAYLVMVRSWLLAHAAPADDQFVRDALACQRAADLDVIVNAYYRHQHTMLYDQDISKAPWSQVVSNVAVLEFLTLMVKTRGWETAAHHWDFTTITLSSVLASVLKSARGWGTARGAMLTRAALALLRAVYDFVLALPKRCERAQPAPHVHALLDEWRDIFAPDTFASVYRFIIHVLDSCTSISLSAPAASVLSALTALVRDMRFPALGGGAAPKSRAGIALESLVTAGAAALARVSHPAHKYLAYTLLDSLAKDMVFDDSCRLNVWCDEDAADDEMKARPRFVLDLLTAPCHALRDHVEAALAHLQVGEETCSLVRLSDSHALALGWLLLGDVQARMAELANGDLKQFYIRIFRECNFTPPLLATALRLLPAEVFAYAHDNNEHAPAPAQYADWFLDVPRFDMASVVSSVAVCALSCRAVYRGVCGAGCGPARGWWGAAAPRAGRLLERVVAAYVAPHAARLQLKELHERANEIQDAEINIAWSTNEVVCSYAVEESRVELRVWLARTHPLTPPRLHAPAAPAAAPGTHWLALYLAYQNGTLLNALRMWTQSVNARVARSPQCYICYCRLHPSSGRLPRVPCHQCKNKFHNLCLRKWFSTSNKSNCPLCRAAF